MKGKSKKTEEKSVEKVVGNAVEKPIENIVDEKAEEKRKKTITREAKKFLDAAEEFLKEKNGGALPPEWKCSLKMLEIWYRQFLQLTYEIEDLPSIIVQSRYGAVPSPLLNAQSACAIRVEKALSDMGLTFKSAAKLNVVTPKEEESVLEKFMKGKVEKR